jgi:PhzF family phenazine biosynthesis protein
MIDNKTIFQVDAFTDEPFKGNPAGVMIVSKDMTADWMQNIALEMNLSETAFVIPGENGFRIRYFTPTREVPLCGHATLASSHILYELGIKSDNETIELQAEASDLSVKKEKDWIVMNFPVYPIHRIEVSQEYIDSLGFKPLEMYSSKYDWLIALAESEFEILNFKPDFELLTRKGLGHLMITSKCDSKRADFVVRCFAPLSGINEDPVTGSAHCALTPLWSERLGKKEMISSQLSARTGILRVQMDMDRVLIKGRAITIFDAKLRI